MPTFNERYIQVREKYPELPELTWGGKRAITQHIRKEILKRNPSYKPEKITVVEDGAEVKVVLYPDWMAETLDLCIMGFYQRILERDAVKTQPQPEVQPAKRIRKRIPLKKN